jgi:hypothetical protein
MLLHFLHHRLDGLLGQDLVANETLERGEKTTRGLAACCFSSSGGCPVCLNTFLGIIIDLFNFIIDFFLIIDLDRLQLTFVTTNVVCL